ncbi:voltage-gated ion channel superfamily isoform A [Micractinium conductrix]|uniref:Voltage-gated ion channel superfamily isoform A n=1 Tax=Micractinium conductrix TaxID=554055 RepID=A0A2P6VC94_9CHLO|nr:voltage-gated ion channel superfamily isoform A [Micractinium conductrix]|eukprot:PSC71712.1 voltage-gated ion channel superfamily isoform A [Micractinium conductrix]
MLAAAGSPGARSGASSPTSSPHEPLSAALSTASTAAALNSLAAGLAASSSSHPNIFVRGLPLQWGENEITAVFGQFGQLTSLRLVRHSVTKHSLGYGFVRYGSVTEAQAAIGTLDGTSVLGHTLQVKFADADAGPPTMPAPSGLTPSDSCYVKHLPASYGVQEVQQLFETHGAVLDVKLFPCLDQFRGASALVRMASLEASERAITALNNSTPPGAVQSLIVRFAESAAEKAARLSRREAKSLQRMRVVPNGMHSGSPFDGMAGGLGPDHLQQALSALSLGGMPQAAALRSQLPPPPLVPQAYQPQMLSSICIKGMPPNADRLWVFENFSRYGAVAGLRILIDEASGLCNGTGFVNFADTGAAERARQAMNGMRAGDKILHVMVQTNTGAGMHSGMNSGMASPSAACLSNGRSHSGTFDVASAAVLAAAVGQPVLPVQADWQLLTQPGQSCMWIKRRKPSMKRPRHSAPIGSQPSGRGAAPQSLYEKLKHLRPAAQQEELEEQEVYWEDQDLQERRIELQRRQQDEAMLERIKRRVAGEKMNVPRALARGKSVRVSAAGGPASARSQASTPGSGGTRRLLGAAEHSAGAADGPGPNAAAGDTQLEVPGCCAIRWAPVQRAAERLTTHPDFQLVVMLVILLNCVALAMFRPSLPEDGTWNGTLKDIDIAVSVLFAVEMCLMVVAAGGPIEYLRGPWNVFDFLMVLAGFTTFIPASSNASSASGSAAVHALRALRALRPLRTITRFEALRSIVVCFIEAVPMLVSVIGLLYFFMLLFASAATVLFLDASYFSCTDPVTGDVLAESSSGEMWGCGLSTCPAGMECREHRMALPLQTAGFGNIGLSLLSLFQVTTQTDWAYQLYMVMDRAGPAPLIFYVFYILLQSYFVVNLFLAVLKHRFAAATALYSKVVAPQGRPRSTLVLAWLAVKARLARHMDTQRSAFEERMSQRSSRSASSRCSSRAGAASPELLLAKAKVDGAVGVADGPPSGFKARLGYHWFEFRWRVRQVIDHPAFTGTFMALILGHTVLLAMTTAGMSDEMRAAQDTASTAFTYLFLAECLLKLLGLGFAGFRGVGMNVFDAVVVAISLVDMAPAYAAALDVASNVLTCLFAVEVAMKMIGLGAWGFSADPFNAFDALVVALGVLEMALMMGANGNALRSFRTLRILRSFRVLRILKIFRYLESLRVMSEVVMGSMGQFMAVALLMVLFIFVFALIGLQVFGLQSASFDPPLPSFMGFWNSFILVFQVLTLENWPDTMFKVQAVSGWPSVLFFVAWVTVGKWLILTLFLAITLSAFEQSYASVTRTTTGGSLVRMVSLAASLPQRLLVCCCGCLPGRRRQVEPAQGDPISSAALKAAAATVPKRACTSGLAGDDAPPMLSAAAAHDATAAMSAAMRAKLGVAADSPHEAAGTGRVSSRASGRRVSFAAAEQDLIRAVPAGTAAAAAAVAAVDEVAGSASEQHQLHAQSPLSRVTSMVQHFEGLAPSRLGQHRLEALPEDGQLAGGDPAVVDADGRALPRPKRTASQKARLKAAGQRARFVGAPGDGEEEEDDDSQASGLVSPAALSPLPGSGSDSRSLPSSATGSRSPSPLAGSKAKAISHSASGGSSTRPGSRSHGADASEDQSLAGELQDAESASQFSGISGTSSVGSHLSRLAGHVRRRSRRRDYPPLRGTSLGFLKVDNPLRGFLYNLMTMQFTDYFLVAVVLLSCAEMAMETAAMDPAARRTKVMHWIDVSTTAVFGLEALLKVVAFGFRPYISFNTNKLDLGVVSISVVLLIVESTGFRFLKALRVLRAVRPLRMLTRSRSMLMVFHTLVRSLAAMGNVTVLAGLVFLIFAILGVQLFAGLLWSCNDGSVAGKAECVGTFLDPDTGATLARVWSNTWLNFDNVGAALLTLFITSTLDGYTPTMYMTMATRASPGMQPVPGSNPAAFLFWFAFITLCSFFVLNLYIGVVFFQFQRLKLLSETGSAVLTATQTGHVEMLRAVFRLKPLDVAPLPEARLRRWCHHLAYSKWFDHAMLAGIILNIVLTATTFYNQPDGFTRAQELANTVFSSLVIAELLIRLTAQGPRLYWRSNWNKLDILLAAAATADLATQAVNAAAGTTISLGAFKKIVMLARVLRMLRLVRHSKGIQTLLSTLIISLPAIINVGALLFLLFFVFSYMGVLLFGQVAFQDNLNEHANFTTFPRALLLLFRVATGDNWSVLLRDCMARQAPACDPAAGTCGYAWAPLYFFSFYLMGAMIAMNLLTTVGAGVVVVVWWGGVILETFEKIQDTAAWTLTPQHLEDFIELWAEYDDGSNSIDPKHMEALLQRLPPPMGLGRAATEADILRFVFSLDIPLDERGFVPFHRTAYELVVRCTEAEIPEGELKRRMDRMARRFLNRHTPKSARGEADAFAEHMNFQVALTVMRIQRKWRETAARRKTEREAARPVVPPLRLGSIPGLSGRR